MLLASSLEILELFEAGCLWLAQGSPCVEASTRVGRGVAEGSGPLPHVSATVLAIMVLTTGLRPVTSVGLMPAASVSWMRPLGPATEGLGTVVGIEGGMDSGPPSTLTGPEWAPKRSDSAEGAIWR